MHAYTNESKLGCVRVESYVEYIYIYIYRCVCVADKALYTDR